MKNSLTLFVALVFGIPALTVSAQTIYIDENNTSGVEDGTRQHPFNTVEEGITGSKTGDTIFVKPGNYSPPGGEIKLRPGTILFGEHPTSTIINANIRDTTRNELPFEIHNLTFGEFYCSRGTNLTEFYTKPCIFKNNICQYISVGHAGGYTENGELLTFYPIPFFHIENNTISGEITFNHGAGKIVGMNIIRNNTAENISLKHGAVTAPLSQPEPGYGYLIENNSVSEEIAFKQGAGLDSSSTEIIKNLNRIVVQNNQANYIGISSGGGYTYLLDNNIIQSGIIDASGGCWTTISNNTIINGHISDSSGGTAFNWDCEDPACMVEDQFIENNTIYLESAGDSDEDFALEIKSSSATIRGNKITCKGFASGIQLISGPPTHVIDNIITVEKQAMYGILTDAGYGVVTGNTITGGKIGYSSRSGAVLFENNTIAGSHWGFFSKGFEEVKNNTITNCTGHGMVLAGMRGPISENTITNNDSTGIWVLSSVDLGGGRYNGIGRNIIRGNGYYDMRISINAVTPDTLFINNNVWDHETIDDILEYDILNESTNGNLLVILDSAITKPPQPILLTPQNNAESDSMNIMHSWQQVLNAEYYHFQLSAENDFAILISDDDSLNSCFFTPSGLVELTEYFWRVKAVNLAGESGWSETWSYTTGKATGINDWERSESVVLEVYPNPFHGITTISYSIYKTEFVSMKIYDMMGREVISLINQIQPLGKYKLNLNGNRLKPGLYLCKLTTGDSSQTIKIILSEN